MVDIEKLEDNLNNAIKINSRRIIQHTEALTSTNKKILPLLKDFGIKKDVYTIVTMDMAIELADMLHVSTEESYSILIAVSNLIDKRTLEGNLSVIDNLFMVYPKRNLKHRNPLGNRPTVLHMRVCSSFKKRINQQFVPMWDEYVPNYKQNKRLKSIVVNDIINKISEKRRISLLLSDLFGLNRPDALE